MKFKNCKRNYTQEVTLTWEITIETVGQPPLVGEIRAEAMLAVLKTLPEYQGLSEHQILARHNLPAYENAAMRSGAKINASLVGMPRVDFGRQAAR